MAGILRILQGGNDIHAKGISAIAEVLKDNSVITSVSSIKKCLFLLIYWTKLNTLYFKFFTHS